jgi:GT2 family glycosyltransferase
MRFSNKIAFVVPTRNRSNDLRTMLTSLATQSVSCAQCVIVDSSDEPISSVLRDFPNLSLDYVRVMPPSLAAQRNAGMRCLHHKITLAGYLDDDIVLLEGALEAMLEFWERAPSNVGGSRFQIMGVARRTPRLFNQIFLLDSPIIGKVLPSGFVSQLDPISEDTFVDWLSGGATIWRRAVIEQYLYDEWFLGTGYLEDVEYSYTVAQKYKLAVVAGAKVLHNSPPTRLDRYQLLGRWEVVNRLYFVRKHRSLSMFLCWYALVGLFLLTLGLAFSGRPGQWARVKGQMQGSVAALQCRENREGGGLK